MNIGNAYINFIEDMTGRNRTLNAIKKKYGLVPAKNEDFTAFEKRVYDTIFRKSDPRNNMLVGNGTRLVENTEEMQDILYKFLGFEQVPVDSFEKPDDGSHIGGYTAEEADGSAIVVTKDKPPIMKQFTINNLKEDLEAIVLGRHIDYNMAESGFIAAYKNAGFKDNNPVHKTYARMYDSLLNIEEFVKLHEGIHVVHINNTKGRRNADGHTANNTKRYLKKAAMTAIPVVGPVYKFFLFNDVLESEVLAYKVGLDIYTDYLLSEVQNYSRRTPRMAQALDNVKRDFRSLNTDMSKSIVRVGYLRAPLRGYGRPSLSMLKAAAYGYFSYNLVDNDNVWLYGLGLMLGVSAVNSVIKGVAGAYFDRKINHDVDKVASLIDKYHGPKEFFQESLGKSIREME